MALSEKIFYLYLIILFFNMGYSIYLSQIKKIDTNSIELYLLLTFIIELFLTIVKYAEKMIVPINLLVLYQFLDIFCIVFFSFFYAKKVHKNKKKIITIGILLSILLFIYSAININTYENFSPIVFPLFLISTGLYYIYDILINVNLNVKIQNSPEFWITVSLIFWSIIFIFKTIPRFLFQEYDNNFSENMRIAFQITNVITYALFSLALSKYNMNHEKNT